MAWCKEKKENNVKKFSKKCIFSKNFQVKYYGKIFKICYTKNRYNMAWWKKKYDIKNFPKFFTVEKFSSQKLWKNFKFVTWKGDIINDVVRIKRKYDIKKFYKKFLFSKNFLNLKLGKIFKFVTWKMDIMNGVVRHEKMSIIKGVVPKKKINKIRLDKFYIFEKFLGQKLGKNFKFVTWKIDLMNGMGRVGGGRAK